MAVSLCYYEVGAEDEAGVQGGHFGRQEGLQDTHCNLQVLQLNLLATGEHAEIISSSGAMF